MSKITRNVMVHNEATCMTCGTPRSRGCRCQVDNVIQMVANLSESTEEADFSKSAALKSLKTEHGPASKHALAALAAARQGDNIEAEAGHMKAAKLHDAKADRLEASGDLYDAKVHRKAAAAHRQAGFLHLTAPQADDQDQSEDDMTENSRYAVMNAAHDDPLPLVSSGIHNSSFAEGSNASWLEGGRPSTSDQYGDPPPFTQVSDGSDFADEPYDDEALQAEQRRKLIQGSGVEDIDHAPRRVTLEGSYEVPDLVEDLPPNSQQLRSDRLTRGGQGSGQYPAGESYLPPFNINPLGVDPRYPTNNQLYSDALDTPSTLGSMIVANAAEQRQERQDHRRRIERRVRRCTAGNRATGGPTTNAQQDRHPWGSVEEMLG